MQVTSQESNCSATIPVEFAAIAIHVAVLVTKFPALVVRGGIVPVVEVAAQIAAIVCDPRVVMADIASQAPIPIPSQRRRHTHSHQQENSSNRAFHIFFLRPQSAATEYKPATGGGVAVWNYS
jgi:hypothetical protein